MKHDIPRASYEEIAAAFRYELDTGKVFNKQTRRKAYKGWEAGCADSKGYRRTRFKYRVYPITHIIWMLVYRQWPVGVIDHINGNTSDDRLENLRDISYHHNSCNSETYRLVKATFNGELDT
jgi:hypothetical protein